MIDFELPANWVAVTDPKEAASLEKELLIEAPPGHVLFAVKTQVLARHESMDDVLYRTEDGRLFEVHLTWYVETDPNFLTVEEFTSPDAWRQTWNWLA